jgi:hypothetical protein
LPQLEEIQLLGRRGLFEVAGVAVMTVNINQADTSADAERRKSLGIFKVDVGEAVMRNQST